MPEVIADWNKEGVFKKRPPSAATSAVLYIPKTSQTALLCSVLNTDESATAPTNYVYGGIGSIGPVMAVKTTTGAPADANFSGATPVVPAPPIGTFVYNTFDHKIYARDAAGSWLASAALA